MDDRELSDRELRAVVDAAAGQGDRDTRPLVKRLRANIQWYRHRGNDTIARDCEEAAHEIERLQAVAERDTESRIAAAVAAERDACREVVEECIRTQAHIASNAREALSEASARIFKRGRA